MLDKPDSIPSRFKSPPSNVSTNIGFDHSSVNRSSTTKIYRIPEGHDNFVTQPVPRLTDIDYGKPPMPIYAVTPDEDIQNGRVVIARPAPPAKIGSRPPDKYRVWRPKGADPQYRRDASNMRYSSSRKNRPATSEGYNTYG